MARIKSQNINGPFVGRIGNIVGCRWKDTYYIRTRPARVKHPNTERQMAQRMRFVNTQTFLKPMLSFLRLGFASYTSDKSAYNAAMSYNIKNALTGIYPDISVDASKALVSMGRLPGNVKAVVKSTGEGRIKVFWNNIEHESEGSGNDRIILVVRGVEQPVADFKLDVARRSDGEAEMKLSKSFLNTEAYCYLVFIKQEMLLGTVAEEFISNSVFCGKVLIS
ncbi:MAG: hypothetical protein JXR65_04820 [Bacteroidales bacterium]|nr:hypothetical protein [Bacteroidales bacterium]